MRSFFATRLRNTVLLLLAASIAGASATGAEPKTEEEWLSAFEPYARTKSGPQNYALNMTRYQQVRYVSAQGGSDTNNDGSLEKPWSSLEHTLLQISDAAEDNRYAVLVAAGNYAEQAVNLKPFVELFGGFNRENWSRDIHAHATVLDGGGKFGPLIVGADNARIDGFHITGARSAGQGGAILCDGVSPEITNNIITNNATPAPQVAVTEYTHGLGIDGGAIACTNQAGPVIANNLFAANSTALGMGAAIFCRDFSSPLIARNVFYGNVAGLQDNNRSRASNGGAIACTYYASPGIAYNVIVGNSVHGNSDAGGIFAEYNASPVIYANAIVGNAGDDDGGGMYIMASSDPLIARNWIVGNVTNGSGGAIRVSKEGRARVYNNVITHNSQGYAAVNCNDSWMLLVNNTICDNISTDENNTAGFMYVTRYEHILPPKLINNILYFNENGSLFLGAHDAVTSVTYNVVDTPNPRPTNLNQDPLFQADGFAGEVATMDFDIARHWTRMRVLFDRELEAGELIGRVVRVGTLWTVVAGLNGRELTVWGDMTGGGLNAAPTTYEFPRTYHLAADSPCIDAGANLNPTGEDIDGQARPYADEAAQGGMPMHAIDLGADEFHPVSDSAPGQAR